MAAISGALSWAGGTWLGWDGWLTFGALMLLGALSVVLAYLQTTLRWAPADLQGDEPRMHLAVWNSENYDRMLDPRIPHARHALTIDETRAQFVRVTWGGYANKAQVEEYRFKQRWFAGNHSDIGGSYPDEESRLSDISLKWMVEEAVSLPQPLLVDWNKLHLYPDASGMQHCEVFAQQQGPWWARLVPWPSAQRTIHPEAELDPTVYTRFDTKCILDCDQQVAYRPEALRQHAKVKQFYPTN